MIIASVLVGIIVGIGSALCVLPGLIAALFLYFTTVAVVDPELVGNRGSVRQLQSGQRRTSARRSWCGCWRSSSSPSARSSGVGLLVAVPVAALLVAYAWRKLTGGYVAPATP